MKKRMRNFGGCFKADLHRAFLSPVFWIVVLFVLISNLLALAEEYMMHLPYGGASVIYLFANFTMQQIQIILIGAAVLPFGLAFCSDWKNQFIRPCLVRSAGPAYAWAKVGSAGLSSFAAIFLGCFGTAILLSGFLPDLDPNWQENDFFQMDAIHRLAADSPVAYYAVQSAIWSFGCMTWTIFALLVSSYLPNPLVTIAAPLIAFYVLAWFVPLPWFLQPTRLLYGELGIESLAPAVLLPAGVDIGLALIMGALFNQRIQRLVAGG